MDRSSSWTNAGRNADCIPPSRVARMVAPSPRPPPSSTAEAVATARRAEYGTGGSILPVLPSASPNASKRSSWTTPLEDEFLQSCNENFAPPPRRAEAASMAATRRAEPTHQHAVDGLFASETEQAQLAYMEHMYGTINLLNAELESERRNRAALEATAAATYSDYLTFDEDVQIPVSEPAGYLVSQTPVAPSSSPRKLRTMPTPPSQPPQTQYRAARPPVSPRSLVKSQGQELCTTLGKNAELRIRSRDMERTVEKTELKLELALKQIKMAERRAENREEKLRALLKEKLNWQKELKATRAQVVEEKMRQVGLFREVEAAKRHFAAELEAVEQELRATQEENAQLRTHAAEIKAQMNFQARKMDEMARQAQDEKTRFVTMIEDTRHRFREWKQGEAEALEAAHELTVRNLKTEYELKMERHQDEKQKLRDKVNDLEVSMRLLQKDRALSPLELSLRKAVILGSKENTGTIEAEQIETQSRIMELESLLAHSQEYQARQESILKLSEATISRLMREREVTALENLSLHPFGVQQQLPRSEDLSYDTQLTTLSSPVRRTSPPNTPQSPVMSIESLIVRSPKSRSHTPRRADLEASIASAAQMQEQNSTREQNLLDELVQLRKELTEAKAKAVKVPGDVTTNDCIDKVPCESPIPSDEAPAKTVDEKRHSDCIVNNEVVSADEIDAASSPNMHAEQPNDIELSKSDSYETLPGETNDEENSVAVQEAVDPEESNSQAKVTEAANPPPSSELLDEPFTSNAVLGDINAQEADSVQVSSSETDSKENEENPNDVQPDSAKDSVDRSLEVQNTPTEALAGAELEENVAQTFNLSSTDDDSVVAVDDEAPLCEANDISPTPEDAASDDMEGNKATESADVQQSDVEANDRSAIELQHNTVDVVDTGELVHILVAEIVECEHNDNETHIDGEVSGELELPESEGVTAPDDESKYENDERSDEPLYSSEGTERQELAIEPTPERLKDSEVPLPSANDLVQNSQNAIDPEDATLTSADLPAASCVTTAPSQEPAPIELTASEECLPYEENEPLPPPDVDVSNESDGNGNVEMTGAGATEWQQSDVKAADEHELACMLEPETKEVKNNHEELLVDEIEEVPAELELQESVSVPAVPIPNSEVTELLELVVGAQSTHVEDDELHGLIVNDLEGNSLNAINDEESTPSANATAAVLHETGAGDSNALKEINISSNAVEEDIFEAPTKPVGWSEVVEACEDILREIMQEPSAAPLEYAGEVMVEAGMELETGSTESADVECLGGVETAEIIDVPSCEVEESNPLVETPTGEAEKVDEVDASEAEIISEVLEELADFPPVRPDPPQQREISSPESEEIAPVPPSSESPEIIVAEAFVTLVKCTALSLVSSRQENTDGTSGISLENVEDATDSVEPENVGIDPADAIGATPARPSPSNESNTVADSNMTVTIDGDEPVNCEQTIGTFTDANTPDAATEDEFGLNSAAEEQDIVSGKLPATEGDPETPIEDPVTENEELVAAMTKIFAENFVKEVIEMFDSAPSRSENQGTHDVTVDEVVTATSADDPADVAEGNTTEVCTTISTNDATETTAEVFVDVYPTDVPNAANESEVQGLEPSLTTADECSTTVPRDELLNDSPDPTSLIEGDQLVQQDEPETLAIITSKSVVVEAAGVDDKSDSSEPGIPVDLDENLAIESPVDTFVVAKDFVDAVESEALSAILRSLQDASCSDSTQAESELEHEGIESNSTPSTIEGCNLSSEEQDESYIAITEPKGAVETAVEVPTSAVVEDFNVEEETRPFSPDNTEEIVRFVNDCVATAENEVLANLSALCSTSDSLGDVEKAEIRDVEEQTVTKFSTQEIVSDVACHFASQAITEVLTKLSEPCSPIENENMSDEVVSVVEEHHSSPQETPPVECSSAQDKVDGDEFSVEMGEEAREVPKSTQEVNRADIPPMETTGEEAVVSSDDSVAIKAVPAADLQIDDDDKAFELIIAEMVAMITLEEDGACCDEVDQGVTSVANQESSDISSSSSLNNADHLLSSEVSLPVEDPHYPDSGEADCSLPKDEGAEQASESEPASDVTDEEPSDALGHQPEASDNSLPVLIGGPPSIQECEAVSAEEIIPSTDAQLLQDHTSAAIELTLDEIPSIEESAPTSESDKGRPNDTISHEADPDAVVIDIDGVNTTASVMESIIDTVCHEVELGVESWDIDESQTVDKQDVRNEGVAVESSDAFIVHAFDPTTEESTAVESNDNSTVVARDSTAEGNEASTLEVEVSESLDTDDARAEGPDKQSDIEPYAATSFGLVFDDGEAVVRLTLESLVDRIADVNESTCTVAHIPQASLEKANAEDQSSSDGLIPENDTIAEIPAVVVEDTTGLPLDECNNSSEVALTLCTSVKKKEPKHRAQSVHFAGGIKEGQPDHQNQTRRSVLLWKAPFDTACTKEAVASSAKRRASRRRTSRRIFADLLAFPTELARFTASDTTLLAYDARHEQGQQPFSLLDDSILNINPNGRHIHLDDQDERVGSKIIGKRKTLMQELHSKNLALRQIPRFNYVPMCIKFQWSDFVVASPVRPSNTSFGEGHISKSPVDPLRLLQKKGAKLPCGSYVVVSAFIRPLEDGNENLRVQIYDAERVEEFQFDFSEDIMKRYHLEATGMEAQSLEFLGHLEFRRDEDTIIIKLPEKKAGDGTKEDGDRIQSERTMFAGGDPRKREPKQNMSVFRQNRPASSPAATRSHESSEFSSSSSNDPS